MSAPPPAPPSAPPRFRLGHVPAFDGLRGVAILLVLLFHLHGRLFKGGYVGVDLFFVLSGFLITALLLQEWEQHAAISFARFYARRALRLLPALYTLLACYLVALQVPDLEGAVAAQAGVATWWPAVYAGTYVSNWTRGLGEPMGLFAHTWSLSIEEQFYLLWPPALGLTLRARWPYRRVALAVALAATLAALHRSLLWHHRAGPLDVYRIYDGFDTRADALLIGCLTALMVADGVVASLSPRALTWASRAGLLLLVAAAQGLRFPSGMMFYGGMTLIAVISAVLILQLLRQPKGLLQTTLQWSPLLWLGRRSYGLYLWHYPVFVLTKGWPGPVRILLAVAAAALSYAVIERPALRLKERFRRPEQGSGDRVQGSGKGTPSCPLSPVL